MGIPYPRFPDMKKPDSMKTVFPLILALGLFGAGCVPTPGMQATPEVRQNQTANGHADALSQRESEYAAVFDQAQRQGLIAGALRGAMLGLLIDGERGAFVGATVGAMAASAYAVTVADQLLQEREEFQNRQQIIENILAASKGATARSLEDAELVDRAVTEHLALGAVRDPALRGRVAGSISTIQRAAEMRAVLIEEMLQEAELSDAARQDVRAQIDLQREALRRIRAGQSAWSAQNHG